MMKYLGLGFIALALSARAGADTPVPGPDIRAQVDNLVHRHYIHGIPYANAHALGAPAIPYLLELLQDPGDSRFWVNEIVTIGHIEDGIATSALISFVEERRGEIDGFTFRAVTSVPFALGCIAGGGDDRALAYLLQLVDSAQSQAPGWSYGTVDVRQVMVEKAVVGLAVSGRPEARRKLESMQLEMGLVGVEPDRRFLIKTIDFSLQVMDRLASEGKQGVFDPPAER